MDIVLGLTLTQTEVANARLYRCLVSSFQLLHGRNAQSNRFRSFEVNHHLAFGRSLNQKITRLFTSQNAIGVACCSAPRFVRNEFAFGDDAALAFHIVPYVPAPGAQWLFANLRNALVLNVILAIFNLLPVPPLDGGRILVGILPGALARVLSRAEPYGLLILIGLLFVLPMLGVDPLSRLIMTSTNAVAGTLLRLTGNI